VLAKNSNIGYKFNSLPMGLEISHSIPTLKTSADETLDWVTIEGLSVYPEYLQRHSHLVSEIGEQDSGKEKVIFLKDLGYQRKGMKSSFYTDFQNGRPYIDIEIVKKAFEYLKADHINTLEMLQKNFRERFIDNFVEGESIFLASW
jgi:hypothetical protein